MKMKIYLSRASFKVFYFFAKHSFSTTKDIEKNNSNLVYVAQILVWVDLLRDEMKAIKQQLVLCSDLSRLGEEDLLNKKTETTLDGHPTSALSQTELEEIESVIAPNLEKDKKEMAFNKVEPIINTEEETTPVKPAAKPKKTTKTKSSK